MNVQGHRGARGLRPESTLPAFEVALDLMVPTLELDLHLTADDQLLVWHDEALWSSKCTPAEGAPELPLPIRQLDSGDLGQFRCDRNPEPERFDAQTAEPTALAGDDFGPILLPQLFEFVQRYSTAAGKSAEQRANAEAVEFNIETKRVESNPEFIGDDFDGENAGVFELKLLEDIDAAGLTDRCMIQSFDFRSLRAIREVRTDIRLSALSEFVPDPTALAGEGFAIWSPYYLILTAENVAAAQADGLEVLPWTVNETDAMQSIVDMGVDGFISDRPDLAMAFASGSPHS